MFSLIHCIVEACLKFVNLRLCRHHSTFNGFQFSRQFSISRKIKLGKYDDINMNVDKEEFFKISHSEANASEIIVNLEEIFQGTIWYINNRFNQSLLINVESYKWIKKIISSSQKIKLKRYLDLFTKIWLHEVIFNIKPHPIRKCTMVHPLMGYIGKQIEFLILF